MAGKSPAFRFYPSDFMGSPDVQSMELAEVGAYTFLLCVAWQQDRHGTLPNDDARLRRWSRMSADQWSYSRDIILAKFPVIEEGLRGNKRMMDEAAKQERFSESQRMKSAKRWDMPKVSHDDAETMPGDIIEEPRGNPSVSVSVSKKQIHKEASPSVQLPAFISEDLWASWETHRKGLAKKKGPWTNQAAKIFISKCVKAYADDLDVVQMIENSILGGYPSIYPDNGPKRKISFSEKWAPAEEGKDLFSVGGEA